MKINTNSHIETYLWYESQEYIALSTWFWDSIANGNVSKASKLKRAIEGMAVRKYHYKKTRWIQT